MFITSTLFYLAWSFPSSNSLSSQTQSSSIHHKASLIYPEGKTKKSSIIQAKPKLFNPIHKPKQNEPSLSKNERLTLHLHTHHHHHIHNSNSAAVLKSLNTTATKPFVEEKTSRSNKEEYSEKETNSNALAPNIDDEVLNLSTNNKTNINQSNVVIKKSTRRKSSPIKRPIQSRAKSSR